MPDFSNNSSNGDQSVSVMGLNPPSLSPLNITSENMLKEWKYWQRSFSRYCRLVKLSSEEDKIDIFYAYIGRSTEEYLRDLPNFAELNTVVKLMEVLERRYSKSPNILCERYNFRRVKILPKETIKDFNARLNSYSKYCNFNNYTRDLAHLDQIILNASSKLREKLLLEKDLSLSKALDQWFPNFFLDSSRTTQTIFL